MTNIEILKSIKNTIEKLNKQQQIEILKLLINDSINISENSNGTFVNLTEIDDAIIFKMQEYINFIKTQDNNLSNIEVEKKQIENNFFNKKNTTLFNTLD